MKRWKYLQAAALPATMIITLLFSGCAGPLDSAVRQSLETSFVTQQYVAKANLGSRYGLEYTNNLLYGRSAVGVFIDNQGIPRYETDASLFEKGTSGKEYTLDKLTFVDRDLDYGSFAQTIQPGQLVSVQKIDDRSDQIVLEVNTVREHPASKTYEINTSGAEKALRSSRLHFVFGKEAMKTFGPDMLDALVAHLLEPAPVFASDEEKVAYIREHASTAAAEDLAVITGMTLRQIVELQYTDRLAEASVSETIRTNLTGALADLYEELAQEKGIWLEDVELGESDGAHVLALVYGIQEFTSIFQFYTEELRAGLFLIDTVIPSLRSVALALASDPDMPLSTVESGLSEIMAGMSYLVFDKDGTPSLEVVTCTLPVAALSEYASGKITQEALLAESAILLNQERIRISKGMIDSVKGWDYSGRETWKKVNVRLVDWDSEYDSKKGTISVTGKVENTGNWIAKDVEMLVVGKKSGGKKVRDKTSTLYGFLRPGESKKFSITLDAEDVSYVSASIEDWEAIE